MFMCSDKVAKLIKSIRFFCQNDKNQDFSPRTKATCMGNFTVNTIYLHLLVISISNYI